MAIWCVAGAPLPAGSGWRIWYSTSPNEPFAAVGPAPVVVRRQGQAVATTQQWQQLSAPAGWSRPLGVATVQLTQPVPGQMFEITIPELAGRAALRWQTLPTEIGPTGVSLLFSSCFWQNDDKDGYYRAAVQAILAHENSPRPAFKLLIGDQLYLDWPSTFSFAGAPAITSQRYEQYWADEAYRDVLLATPNFFLCDDHEFWNDYPERQLQLQRTWTAESRAAYAQAANEFYDAFQASANGRPQRWFVVDMTPASFFLADTRSERTAIDHTTANDPDPHIMGEAQFAALEAWQQNLTGPGVLVLGQPMFQADGDFRDHSLSNFKKDYRRLMKLITASLAGDNADRRPHDILIMSGDIHTGRHTRAWIPSQQPNRTGDYLHELIASPASRVLVSSNFDSSPSPEMPPATIPPTPEKGERRWTISREQDVLFTTVENNLGILRLFPSEKNARGLRVEFVSYLVRPSRQPIWRRNPFANDTPSGLFAHGAVPLYSSSNKTILELR